LSSINGAFAPSPAVFANCGQFADILQLSRLKELRQPQTSMMATLGLRMDLPLIPYHNFDEVNLVERTVIGVLDCLYDEDSDGFVGIVLSERDNFLALRWQNPDAGIVGLQKVTPEQLKQAKLGQIFAAPIF
jgi:hypothetical protein